MPKTNTSTETTSKTYTLGSAVTAKLHRRFRLAAMANDTNVSDLVAQALQAHADALGFIDPQDITTPTTTKK